jgi:putative hydrolase of the HAD superfamily
MCAAMKKNSIEVIFFDLGKVIVDFNHFQIAEKLLPTAYSEQASDPKMIFDHIFHPIRGLCCDFNAGKISPEDFYSELRRAFGFDLSFEAFVPIWSDIFTENKDITGIIKELAGQFRLFLLSNTDPLHFSHVLKNVPALNLFEEWILSYEVGFCKPDKKIYQIALERAGIRADQSVYIDDMTEYVSAAEKIGIQGIHFTSAKNLKDSLSGLLPFHFSDHDQKY